jgi:hypothetical protein
MRRLYQNEDGCSKTSIKCCDPQPCQESTPNCGLKANQEFQLNNRRLTSFARIDLFHVQILLARRKQLSIGLLSTRQTPEERFLDRCMHKLLNTLVDSSIDHRPCKRPHCHTVACVHFYFRDRLPDTISPNCWYFMRDKLTTLSRCNIFVATEVIISQS